MSTAKTRRVISEAEQPVLQFWAALFDALIAGDVRVLVGASRDRAAHEGKRLRLVLRIRPPELSRLPWEFHYNMLERGPQAVRADEDRRADPQLRSDIANESQAQVISRRARE